MEELERTHFDISRKIISNMTTESWQTIPHACITYEADLSEILDDLKEINQDKNIHITINTLLLKIITEALKCAPRMNGHIKYGRHLVRGVLTTYKNVDISMPVILKNGKMMTLNLKNAGDKSLPELQNAVSDLLRRAESTNLDEVMYEVSMDNTLTALKKGHFLQTLCRLIGSKTGSHKIKHLKGKEKKEYYRIPESERLTKDDLKQGTITISNMGSLKRNWNGICTILEIIPPEVCAIALGAVTKKPVCRADGSIGVSDVMPITIAFDHRALDTSDVIPFLDKLDEILSQDEIPSSWL